MITPISKLDAALDLARRGFHLVPLHAPTANGCSCGRHDCSSVGKHPRLPCWQQSATTDQSIVRQWFANAPHTNVGVLLGPKSAVIDVECDSPEAEAELLPLLGGAQPPTFRGARGRHRLFRWQDGLPAKAVIHVGAIEVRIGNGAKAAQSVFPPSVHKTGVTYAWEYDGELQDLPPLLRARICEESNPTASALAPPAFTPPPSEDVIDRARKYLATLPPAISGQNGSSPTFRAACVLVLGFGLTPDQALPLLTEYSATCVPPWTEAELRHKLAGANNEPGPRGYLLNDRAAESPVVDISAIVAQGAPMVAATVAQPPEATAASIEPEPPEATPSMLSIPGFVNEFVDTCTRHAPYPNLPIAFLAALSMLGLLTGRKTCDRQGTRTNVYGLGLADSASGKNFPRQVIKAICSALGLHQAIGDQFASGQALEDQLAISPASLFLPDEFDTEIREMATGREGTAAESKISAMLRFFTDAASTVITRARASRDGGKKDERTTIVCPHLCILATCIPEQFYSAINERLLTNGLFARFLIIQGAKRGRGQDCPPLVLPDRLLDIAKYWTARQPGGGNLNPEAQLVPDSESAADLLRAYRDAADGEYATAADNGDQVAKAVWGRAYEHARRLALLYALSESHADPQITDPAVGWSTTFVDNQVRRMLFMAGQYTAANPFHAACLKVLRKLREAPGHQLSHSALLRAMHIDTKSLGSIIDTLIDRGDIERHFAPGGGRTGIVYRLKPTH